ncbi:MAG: type II toxin-antitoxin system PemK/MazF family toxin [Firmicutes bacterium]|nr:type II toxin-antitoxin system PemK/MazF family toxin [Bacillota bacterium]
MKANRGEIWLIDLNPVIGHEQAGIRPALIVSDNLFNHSLAEMVIVLPITSKAKGIPSHIMIDYEFLKCRSYIKTEDIRAVSSQRLIKKLGEVDFNVLEAVEEHLKLLLGFKQ